MSDFDAEWLSLREPYDHAARNVAVTRAVVEWARERAARDGGRPLRIVDLGAGGGSTMRYLAPLLPEPQCWTYIDDYPADEIGSDTPPGAPDAPVVVTRRSADLARLDLDRLVVDVDLVTASALLDLVSAPWLARLLDAMARSGVPGLFALTYDGRTALSPSTADTDRMIALFDRSMLVDKGFGPALGGGAAAALERAAGERGFGVVAGDSPWIVDDAGSPFARRLIGFWTSAAIREEPTERGGIERAMAEWLRGGGHRIVVGHRDAFILPNRPIAAG